jgi:hypothetical protein
VRVFVDQKVIAEAEIFANLRLKGV